MPTSMALDWWNFLCQVTAVRRPIPASGAKLCGAILRGKSVKKKKKR